MRSARLILSCAVISGLIMLISCGDDDYDVPDSGCWINFGIDTPTYEGIWETQESSIDLGGLVPTPGGILYSSDCPYDPGYTITWHNADNGESGTGGAWTIQEISLFFGSYCHTEWMAVNIPLESGDNHLTVTVQDEQGCTGQDSILIRRLP